MGLIKSWLFPVGDTPRMVFKLIFSDRVMRTPTDHGKDQFENPQKSLLIKGGGRAWVIPCVQRADFLPMNIFQILVTSPDVPTINGVKISVQGVAQVKIGSDDQFLR